MSEADSPGKTAEETPPLPAWDSSILTAPQPTNVGTEPLPVEAGRTMIDWEIVAVFPVPSVNVNETAYVPFVNDCETRLPVLPVEARLQLSLYGLEPRVAGSVNASDCPDQTLCGT